MLSNGFSHIATVTDDVDRMVGFYQRVFDADVMFDLDDGLRHAAIDIGGNTVLHVFRVPWVAADDRREAFERGRIDHFGVTVPTVEALLEVRRRLAAEGEGTTNGEIRDFGPVYSLHFVDPDGVHLEVNLMKDTWGAEPVLAPSEWVVVDLEQATTAGTAA
jgi:catechol 2,3-dioxygenase-like lactoylglutathione lyase family enzyme